MLRGLLPLLPIALGVSVYLVGAEPPPADRRAQGEKLFNDGNYNEAYDLVRSLVLDPESQGDTLAADFSRAVACLQNLQRSHEVDAFREEAVAVHAGDWRLLARAADSLLYGEHYGFVVAGEFQRGNQRGGGEYVDSTQRDRVRALQLLMQARTLADQDADKPAVSQLYSQIVAAVSFGREGSEAWRLQALTDLATLPDYDEAQHWRRGWGGGSAAKGAPVDADGNPVL
ncbi:MAG: alpha-2-macroglobulin, partial [Planctomycetaceae bacterium]|nr:alpha-2-macroglobulin [Planctomycetaceae bacterium]